MQRLTNVFSEEELDYWRNHAAVLAAKAKLDLTSKGMQYFSVPATASLCAVLESHFGLRFREGDSIPMRWIKGDTAPHVDVGASAFDNTYLVYLNDSPGELIVDTESYPIQSNTGVVFHEGLLHETRATDLVPRLLFGPMNEFAQPVGSATAYYATLQDALTYTNLIGSGAYPNEYTVGYVGATITSWRIASNSSGTSPQNVVYNNGDLLNQDGSYYLYPAIPCFLEGTAVLCQVDGVETYVPVEKLRQGTLVKTALHGFKPVALVGNAAVHNPGTDERSETRLYKCSPAEYPALTSDLFLTGCHSILEFPITEKQEADTIQHLGKLFITDKKYRLMACLDDRAQPWNSEGVYTVWHFALEHEDDGMNYGVYVNGGLLVESCSLRFLKAKSNMTFC